MTWASTCRSGTGELFMPCVLRSIAVFPAARLTLNMPCQAMGAGGMNECQGGSEVRDRHIRECQKLRGALGGERGLEPRGCPVIWTSSTYPSPSTTVCYADFIV